MKESMYIADTILNQLGGNRFLAMTGAKNLLATGNGLRFSIGRNASKANRVEITYKSDADLYNIEFINYRAWRFDAKRMKEIPEKRETIKMVEDCDAAMLAPIFTRTTGMYTSL